MPACFLWFLLLSWAILKTRNLQKLILGAVLQVLDEAADYQRRRALRTSDKASAQGHSSEAQLPRAVLADTMFSLLEFKPMQTKLRRVCMEALSALANGVLDVVAAASSGMRILQSSAEEVQDAISAMYAIMQRHGGYIANETGAHGRDAIAAAAQAVLLVLQVHSSHLPCPAPCVGCPCEAT